MFLYFIYLIFIQNDYIVEKRHPLLEQMAAYEIHAINKDMYGIIWFGTDQGLFYYDGNNLNHFSYPEFNFGVHINNITPYKNYLLVSSDDGLAKINLSDFKKSKIYRFSLKEKQSLASSYVHQAIFDSLGNIWAATDGGLNKISKAGEITLFKDNPTDSNAISFYHLINVAINSYGQIFAQSTHLTHKYDPKTNLFKSYKISTKNSDKIMSNYYHLRPKSIFFKNEGEFYVGTEDGIARFFKGERFSDNMDSFWNKKYELNGKVINTICQTGLDEKWIATNNGLINLKENSNLYQVFSTSSTELSRINHNQVNALFYDQGLLWVGSNGGLNIIQIDKNPAKLIYVGEQNKTSEVNVLYKSQTGTIYFGSEFGMGEINSSTNKASILMELANVTQIANYDSVNLWVTSLFLKTNTYNVENKKSQQLITAINPKKSIYLKYNLFTDMKYDSFRNIYLFGTIAGGFQTLDTKLNSVKTYSPDTSLYSISDNIINKIYLDPKDSIWIASNKGLNLFIPEKEKFIRFFTKTIIKDIVSIKNTFFIATEHEGLIIWDKLTDKKRYLNINSTLKSNRIKRVQLQETGNIYILTQSNLFNFNPEKNEIETISLPESNQSLKLNDFTFT